MATARQGRTGRVGRQARVMSHRARSALASPPVEIADRVADVVGIAFQRWADRFVSAVMRSVVEPSDRFKQDATVQGVFTEAGRARPDPDRLRSAFTMLESKSADELRVTGVSTRDVVVGGERLQQQWLRQNTDLIKAEQDLRRRVERVLQDPLNQGRSVAEIAKLLEEQVGYSRSRAELTARDQTLKMYSQIQEQRQRAAGIARYVWTTSLDERVREDHAALDGSVQSWDDPPIVDKRTGRREHPGRDFQCRCTAAPILDEDDVADPQVVQEQRQAAANAEAEGRFRRPSTGGAPPPPEPVMAPTPADVERQAEAARVEAERRAAEATADRRIEAARVEAERSAAEAARVEAERRAAEAARVEAERRAAEAARKPAPQHAREAFPTVRTLDVADTEHARAVVQTLDGAGLSQLAPAELQIGDKPIVIRGGRVGGVHDATVNGGGALKVDTSAEMLREFTEDRAPLGDRNLWAVASAMTTEVETMQAAAAHEMGHMVHRKDFMSSAFHEIDRLVTRAGRANPERDQKDFLSQYAATSHEEYFAEAFALYTMRRPWLAANAPRAFAMVQSVLEARGMLQAAENIARASLTTAEMVAAAEDLQVSRGARGVAPTQVEAAVESAVSGRTLQELTAIPFTTEELATDPSLRFLRQDPTFRETGNVADNFGRSRGGLPQITIEPDGSVHLTNGRHRLTVARELGLRQIQARVRKVGKRGAVLWEYVGLIRV